MNRFKKIIGAVTSAAAILSLALFIYPRTMAATDPITISPQHMYILADTGTSINLSSIQATMDGKNYTTGDKLTWTPADTGLTVSGGAMKATTDGVHKVNISVSTVNANIYVVTKQASATEYILYEQNFDNVADGSLPDGWAINEQPAGCTASVQNKQLVLDSSSSTSLVSVRMPDFLNVFDNYTAEADFCLAATNNDTRYCSFIYRMQVDETKTPVSFYPYYQMTVRKVKPKDSVEISERDPSNAWVTPVQNDHGMTLNPSTFYKDKISLYNDRVQEYFNNTMYIDYTGLKYSNGGTGLLSGGSKSIWDNIKISIQPENLTGLTTPTTTTTETTTTAATTITTKPTTVTSATETSTTKPTAVTSATETSTTKPTTVTSATDTSATESTTVASVTTSTAATATTTAIVPTETGTSADTTTAAVPETTTTTTASQQSPKTGSTALPAGLFVLITASSAAVYFNRKK